MRAVKLGGSVLSDKAARGRPRFRGRVASRLAQELAGARGREPLMLIFGGGAFGHPVALKHGVGRRALAASKVASAVADVQAAMEPLRARVLGSLRRARLPVVPVPASASAFSSREGLYWEVEVLQGYAERGLVPVTGGDVLLDEAKGARILSGDEIASHAAAKLGLGHVVFAGDTDGVLEGTQTIASLSASEADALAARLPKASDATGGMAGKLVHAARAARAGAHVDLVNGNRPGQLAAALAGKAHQGTRIMAEAHP